ncbi:TerB family tellurite resistance protein [Bacteroides sp. 214]|uniref:TerB family tellurite resistance protein n=1 Tax=Bacteroides sp. 214 TaxID=2302935 RepID=UPI0013D779C6|nr:TerB family tellurite resistance protein [Bacteroides sp. 214]
MTENEKKMFLGLYQMLLIDAEVHPNELELLYQIGREKGGISEEDIQRTIFSPNTFVSLDSLSDEDRIEYLYNLSRIAWADGRIDDKEIETLQEASRRLGFAEENVIKISEFLLEQARERKSFEELLQTIKNS